MAEVKISIITDTDKAEKNLKGVQKDLSKLEVQGRKTGNSFKNFGNKLNSSFKNLSSSVLSLKGAFVGLAAIAGGGFLVSFIKRSIESADRIGKLADQIGISTNALQELRFAAERSGAGVATLDSSLSRFSKRLGEAAAGGGAASKTYERLGISVVDTSGKIRNQEVVFREAVDAISNLGTQTEQAAAISALFGREGVKLVNTFKDGTAGLKEYADELENLGGRIDENAIRQAEEATDRIADLKIAIDGATTSLILAFGPQIIQGITAFTEGVKNSRKFLKDNSEVISEIGQKFSDTISLVGKLGGALAKLLEKTSDIRNVFLAIPAGLGIIDTEFEPIIEKVKAIETEAEKAAKAAAERAERQRLLLEQQKKAAEELATQWESVRVTLQQEIDATGLEGFEKKIFDVEAATQELINKYGEMPEIVEAGNIRIQAILDEQANKITDLNKKIQDDIDKLTLSEFDLKEKKIQEEFEQRKAAGADIALAQEALNLKLAELEKKRLGNVSETNEKIKGNFNDTFNQVESQAKSFSSQIKRAFDDAVPSKSKGFTAAFGSQDNQGAEGATSGFQSDVRKASNSLNNFNEALNTANAKSAQIAAKWASIAGTASNAKKFLSEGFGGGAINEADALALSFDLGLPTGSFAGPAGTSISGAFAPEVTSVRGVTRGVSQGNRARAIQDVLSRAESGQIDISDELQEEYRQFLQENFGITAPGGAGGQAGFIPGGSSSVVNNLNISTKDIESFRASQGQLINNLSRITKKSERRISGRSR